MVADLEKNRNREFFNEKLLFKVFGIVFLLAIVFLIFEDVNIYKRKRKLDAQIISYQKQIDDIKNSSQNLRDEIANSDNVNYLEKLAYEQLGEQKPGEKEVIFVSPQEKQVQASAPKSFWDNIWQWIKSKF